MNPMVGVLRRNIVSLIRKGRSVELSHPMDSGGLVNTLEQQSGTVTTGTAQDHPQSTAASVMEPAEDSGHEEAALTTPESTTGQPASQEKKKQRQFDFSMSVSPSFKIMSCFSDCDIISSLCAGGIVVALP